MMGRCRRIACYMLLGFAFGVALERAWSSLLSRNFQPFHSDELTHESSPTITCLVIVRSRHYRMLKAAQQTWLKKCDDYVIVQINKQKTVPAMFTTGKECQHPPEVFSVHAKSGWDFLCTSMLLLPRPIQWLLIVPDSLIVIMENLKHVIKDKDWRKDHYMGHPVQHYNGAYNVLSAGILLANATINQLLGRFPDKPACRLSGKYWNNEDVYLGMYLSELGIAVEDTRDDKGRTRFNGFNINTLLFPGKLYRQTDYYKKALYPCKDDNHCCSEELTTVDSSNADHMLIHYSFIYGAFERLANKHRTLSNTEIAPRWEQALRDIGYTGPTHNISNEEYYRIWEKHISPEKLSEHLKDAAAVHD